MAIKSRRRLLVILAAVGVLLTGTSPATAASPTGTTQQMIDNHLRKYPGGQQINTTEISYNEGQFVITFAKPPGVTVGPDCTSGWFCFYDGINYGYPRGRLSSCGWQDLAWWGWQDRTESAHYNTSGSVRFLNHAQGRSDHNNDYLLFSLSSANRTRADVSPYRNMADHVERRCPTS